MRVRGFFAELACFEANVERLRRQMASGEKRRFRWRRLTHAVTLATKWQEKVAEL